MLVCKRAQLGLYGVPAVSTRIGPLTMLLELMLPARAPRF